MKDWQGPEVLGPAARFAEGGCVEAPAESLKPFGTNPRQPTYPYLLRQEPQEDAHSLEPQEEQLLQSKAAWMGQGR